MKTLIIVPLFLSVLFSNCAPNPISLEKNTIQERAPKEKSFPQSHETGLEKNTSQLEYFMESIINSVISDDMPKDLYETVHSDTIAFFIKIIKTGNLKIDGYEGAFELEVPKEISNKDKENYGLLYQATVVTNSRKKITIQFFAIGNL